MTDTKTFVALLIRHGTTRGNLEKRYLGGRSEEGLTLEGRRELETIAPTLNATLTELRLYSSPTRRCLESAAILFPGVEAIPIEGLCEIDFGDFEGKNYLELAEDPRYQAWLDSGGAASFPNGESREDFIERTCAAFEERVVMLAQGQLAAFLCHGGSIMAIMSQLSGKDYFSFQVAPGEGFKLKLRYNADGLALVSYNRLGDRANA